MSQRALCAAGAFAFLATAAACSTATKQKAAETTLTSVSAAERKDTFEATARMLDDHPEFVGELYQVMRRHPRSLEPFLANATADMEDNAWLNETLAKLLASHPVSLERILTANMDAIPREPEARAAMRRAMAAKAPAAVDVLTDEPTALAAFVEATLAAVEKKPAAREAVLAAVKKNRKRLLAVMLADKELAQELTEQVLREAVKDKPALDKILRATGAIDDDGPSPKKSK
jgi:hypothetical protein